MATLRKMMRILDEGEPYTIATDNGEGWLFYFDGKELHSGTRHGETLEDFLDREFVCAYDRGERKHWSDADRRSCPYMELEAGQAFIVEGDEYGDI